MVLISFPLRYTGTMSVQRFRVVVYSFCLIFILVWGAIFLVAPPAQAATQLQPQTKVSEETPKASAAASETEAFSEESSSQLPTPPKLQYVTGVVREILEEQQFPSSNGPMYAQRVRVRSDRDNQVHEVTVGTEFQPLAATQRLSVGNRVILVQQTMIDGSETWVVGDVLRLPVLLWLFLGFLALVFIVSKGQGLRSMLGMVASLAVVVGFIVPQILHGANPLAVSLASAVCIAVVTIYLSHGWNVHSHVALSAMLITMVGVLLLSMVAVHVGKLVGLGSEEAYFLQFGDAAVVNLQGLLLGGIMLGALGILDDICIAQISVVTQLKEVNKDLDFHELYERGLRVGKDHVASLVNTLVLAYAGANLPLFLLFSINKDVPLWVTLNNEIIAEEVVRTLVGSIGLVLAVPVSTVLAAWMVSRGWLDSDVSPRRTKVPHSHAH